jgi:hypothetical protein
MNGFITLNMSATPLVGVQQASPRRPPGRPDPSQLTRDGPVIRRELRPDRRGDDIEARLLVRKRFSVAGLEPNVQPLRRRVLPSDLDQRRREIDPCHLSSCPRSA